MNAIQLNLPCYPQQLIKRTCLILTIFFSVWQYQVSAQCTGGPCNAVRWSKGSAWAAGCPNNAGLIDDSPPANGGIVRCGNSAETQSNIHPNTCYNPNTLNVAPLLTGCINPNNNAPATLVPPLANQQVLWFNFDVRAYAGGYDFQVIGGPDNVGWILFYSNSNDQCIGNTTPGLSGNCSPSALTKYACGTSFTGWASQPFNTPVFENATNVYIMVWDMDFPVGNKNTDMVPFSRTHS